MLCGSSKSSLHRRTPLSSKTHSNSQLLKRLERNRLGLQRGKKRTDICPICKVWDDHTSKEVVDCYSGVHRELEALHPG